MSKFVMVTDNAGFRYAINVDSILWVSPEARSVCLSGIGEQGYVIMTLRPEDIQRILYTIGVADHGER